MHSHLRWQVTCSFCGMSFFFVRSFCTASAGACAWLGLFDVLSAFVDVYPAICVCCGLFDDAVCVCGCVSLLSVFIVVCLMLLSAFVDVFPAAICVCCASFCGCVCRCYLCLLFASIQCLTGTSAAKS